MELIKTKDGMSNLVGEGGETLIEGVKASSFTQKGEFIVLRSGHYHRFFNKNNLKEIPFDFDITEYSICEDVLAYKERKKDWGISDSEGNVLFENGLYFFTLAPGLICIHTRDGEATIYNRDLEVQAEIAGMNAQRNGNDIVFRKYDENGNIFYFFNRESKKLDREIKTDNTYYTHPMWCWWLNDSYGHFDTDTGEMTVWDNDGEERGKTIFSKGELPRYFRETESGFEIMTAANEEGSRETTYRVFSYNKDFRQVGAEAIVDEETAWKKDRMEAAA